MEYEDYGQRAEFYDTTRVPVGLALVLGTLVETWGARHLNELQLLDAGCGTGSYLSALAPHIGDLTGIDRNAEMLRVAAEKLGSAARLVHGHLDHLPGDTAEYDCVLCTQVIHHLDDGSDASLPGFRAFLAEVRRVLGPNGRLVISTTSHAQLRDGFWWAELIPAAIEQLRRRLPDTALLEHTLKQSGFSRVHSLVELDAVLQGASYFDMTGPLRPAWRAGDSTWNLATEAELDAAIARVQRLVNTGTMDRWVETREVRRRTVGQTTFLVAQPD